MNYNKYILSIIAVIKNDKKNLEKTIKSIISQKTKKIEYLIIDGKSNDRTEKRINIYIFIILKILI